MSKAPEIVSHYAAATGFQGIVGSRSIWATDLRYLNDTKELKYGLRSVLATLWEELGYDLTDAQMGELRKTHPEFFSELDAGTPHGINTPSPIEMICRYAANAISHEYGLIERPDVKSTNKAILGQGRVGIYVACFSEEPDDLSQWRGYGDDGGGYSLGFSTDILRRGLTYKGWVRDRDDSTKDALHAISGVPLGPVAYGKKKRKALTKFIASQMIHNDGVTTVPAVHGAIAAMGIILRAASACKSKKFAGEKEWRASVIDYNVEKDIHFRQRPNIGFTPFINLEFPHEALKQVIVGPGHNSRLRMESVEHMLQTAGFSDVTVKKSSVPFRN
ncbi:DUF2971 domain-containing protein [Rhodococcoides fascians]|uniref:DUF2971 domain-containing protein n=1 Tax=Rhodococcoides fascians TaxID=1828 RepID=UPI0037B33FEE